MEKNSRKKGHVDDGIIIASSKAKLTECVDLGREEYDQYDPFQHRDFVNGLGTMGALSHMIKGSLGSGILAMPMAFKNGGLWVSLVGAVLIGFLCTHCVHILVLSSQVLSKRMKRPYLGFAETTEAAFLTGPKRIRSYATLAREVVNISLFISYYMGCTVFAVFVATSLKQVADSYLEMNLNIRIYVLIISVLMVPIGSIRYLKYLVPFSFLALIFLMFGCGFVLYEVFSDLPPLDSRPAFSSWSRIPFYYATMCFAIEGIGTVLPVENAMKKPGKFLGCPGVLNIAMMWLVLMYSLIGFFGYLRYGEDTEGSVTLNLGHSIMSDIVKILVALNVVCSYGLLMCVPSEIIWSYLGPKFSEKSKTRSYYIIRVLLNVGTLLCAAALPNLEPIIGLVGTVCYSTLGLLFPSIVELITFWDDTGYMGRFRWRYYKNYLMIVAWLIALVASTHVSALKVIQIYWP